MATEGREGGRLGRAAVAVGALAALLGAAAVSLHAYGDPRDDLRLTLNAVTAVSGERTWRGALTNRTGRPCRDVAVEIRFLDAEGRPVGAVAGRAAWLAPRARLTLEARLPPEAKTVRIEALHWRRGPDTVVLGPSPRWTFGELPG